MKSTFVVALHSLELPFLAGRGDQIRDGLFITNDPMFVRSLIPDWARPVIGELEYEHLLSSPVLHSSTTHASAEFDPKPETLGYLRRTLDFLNSIWLHRDNAIWTELAFLFYWDERRTNVHSNLIALMPTRADGTRDSLALSRDELAIIRSSYRERFQGDPQWGDPASTLMLRGTSRVMRALYWVHAARIAPGVGERLSACCSALEALFATSTAELAHQLAERAALFVASDPAERFETYRTIKRAYGFRSKILHGDVVRESDVATMLQLGIRCCEILRTSILRASDDPECQKLFLGSSEELDDFMVRLLFGVERDIGRF